MNRRGTAVAAGLGAVGLLMVALLARLDPAGAARLAVCGGALGAAVAVDLGERRIPNRITMPALAILFALWAASGGAVGGIVGGLAFASGLLALALLAPAAFGMGDAKLAFVVALGLAGKAATALTVALLLGAVAAAVRLRCGSAGRRESLPLAPFFAAGALIALLV